MMKFYKIMFFISMIVGTLITISSYSWFSMWMGLEINLLSIIPLMKSSNNVFSSESALKYFITQAMASSIFLLMLILLNEIEYLPQNPTFLLMILNSALFTKMGAAPFHAWFPEVLEGLNWMNCLIMLTWQKIAPMILIMYNMNMIQLLISIIIFSTMVGGILGINQVSLRKILAYSSINHIGWMLASIIVSSMTWTIYFTIYSIITINIILFIKKMNIFYIKQLINSMNNSKMIKLSFNMNFFSLGGMPPFLGFFPKWLTINGLVMNQNFMISLILIIFTMITLFFYLRVTFSSIMIDSSETIIYQKMYSSFKVMLINIVSLSGLAMCTLILNLF